ncbi:hypothetical protein L345_03070, partial [Ophiophagus hannah]
MGWGGETTEICKLSIEVGWCREVGANFYNNKSILGEKMLKIEPFPKHFLTGRKSEESCIEKASKRSEAQRIQKSKRLEPAGKKQQPSLDVPAIASRHQLILKALIKNGLAIDGMADWGALHGDSIAAFAFQRNIRNDPDDQSSAGLSSQEDSTGEQQLQYNLPNLSSTSQSTVFNINI